MVNNFTRISFVHTSFVGMKAVLFKNLIVSLILYFIFYVVELGGYSWIFRCGGVDS